MRAVDSLGLPETRLTVTRVHGVPLYGENNAPQEIVLFPEQVVQFMTTLQSMKSPAFNRTSSRSTFRNSPAAG